MSQGIVIPSDSNEPMRLQEFAYDTNFIEALGEVLMSIDVPEPEPVCVVTNTKALEEERGYNGRASMFVAVHNPKYLYNDPIILGDVAIVGAPDCEGKYTDVPQELVKLLLETPKYRILVQTADDKEAWNGNQRVFDDIHDAYEYAVNLAHRWLAVERVKVAPA